MNSRILRAASFGVASISCVLAGTWLAHAFAHEELLFGPDQALGEQQVGLRIVLEYPLTNNSSAVQTISRIVKSCDCAAVTVKVGQDVVPVAGSGDVGIDLAPGSQGAVVVELDVKPGANTVGIGVVTSGKHGDGIVRANVSYIGVNFWSVPSVELGSLKLGDSRRFVADVAVQKDEVGSVVIGEALGEGVSELSVEKTEESAYRIRGLFTASRAGLHHIQVPAIARFRGLEVPITPHR